MAMIIWAAAHIKEQASNIHVVYCDTGWAAPWWIERVYQGEATAKYYGFTVARVKSIGMESLVRLKKGWPGNGQQFCTAHLKGIPFLQYADEIDPKGEACVMIGKRREESAARKDTPEYIESSEYHGGRTVWHPLYLHTSQQRDKLLSDAGFVPMPHRSMECNPCVNANRQDILRLSPGEIERVNNLEAAIGKPMFRPKRFNTVGIHGVVAWARDGKKRADIADEESACASLFGCGL